MNPMSMALWATMSFTTPSECLTKNIYEEAGNQSLSGKIAVANVTLNRAKRYSKFNSVPFSSSICSVIYSRKQFSWTLDKDRLNRVPTIHNRLEYSEWLESKAVANMLLLYNFDITNGSTHYHADYVAPVWRNDYKVSVVYGSHIFYKKM